MDDEGGSFEGVDGEVKFMRCWLIIPVKYFLNGKDEAILLIIHFPLNFLL